MRENAGFAVLLLDLTESGRRYTSSLLHARANTNSLTKMPCCVSVAGNGNGLFLISFITSFLVLRHSCRQFYGTDILVSEKGPNKLCTRPAFEMASTERLIGNLTLSTICFGSTPITLSFHCLETQLLTVLLTSPIASLPLPRCVRRSAQLPHIGPRGFHAQYTCLAEPWAGT